MKKKKTIFTSLLAAMCFSVTCAQTVSRVMYVDFGEPNKEERGRMTEGADANGNYWTNVYSSGNNYIYPGTCFPIVASDGSATGGEVQINVRFMSNGRAGGGGLVSPSAELLGDMAVATATEDYLFMESFQDYNIISFHGLDPQRGYRFHSFGSRETTEDRSATFVFEGDNKWEGLHRMSGSGIGDGGYNGNNNSLLVSEPVFPDKDGTIRMTIVKRNKNGMVHINAMKIEELEGVTNPYSSLSLERRMYIDIGETANDSRGHCTLDADANGNHWNNLTSGDASSNRIPAGTRLELIGSDNTPTGFVAETLQMMETNGVEAGGVREPKAEDLGDLAVATATEDYVWINDDNQRQIRFSQLDKNRCYRFYIFGSRITSETDDRNSIYTLEGLDDWASQITTSGRCVGGRDTNGADIHGNVRNVAVSDYMYPDADGCILFTVRRERGMAHFNAIKIEEYSGGVRPDEKVEYKSFAITGSASENGADVLMKEIVPGGNVYEAWLKVQPGTFALRAFATDGSEAVFGKGDVDGQVVLGGQAYSVDEEKVVRVKFDYAATTIEVTPVELYVKGNIVPDGTRLEYAGDGVWSSEVALDKGDVFLFSDKYFYFAFNNDDNLAVKRLSGSRSAMAMPSEGFATENIRLNRGTYTLGLNMRDGFYTIDAPIDENKISVFGSSVANGQGAIGFKGYAYNYGQELGNRYQNGLSEHPFYTSGISIGGNNTRNLLDRYDELTHDFGRYVIFGLSLGNEGVHEAADKQAVVRQFSDNMQTLIGMARADGKVPVIMNNYTRGDYTADDYNCVKELNLLIHEWDLPSVNVLGAIDNGAGRWADGFMEDNAHPTTNGHMEFFYAMPLSLFDALAAGKPLPERDMSTETTLGDYEVIRFTGEGRVHPYTVSLRVKGAAPGLLFSIATLSGSGVKVSASEDGTVAYVSPAGKSVTGTTSIDDGEWHTVTLTHYYAQKRTLLYVDDICQGEVSERMTIGQVTVGDGNSPVERLFGEVFFWRSAMSPDEVAAVAAGRMLKSSLEIYVPLSDADGENPQNLAQTLNTVTRDRLIPDGIVSPTAAKSVSDGRAYTLGGRLATPGKSADSIHIMDGKKFVVR